ncbi:MAG: exodeoxyribonuclease VII small subunit [Clostridia bacterium]|nr:exodeoxyribonuclease VII small subunit [Clostridia bacterium]
MSSQTIDFEKSLNELEIIIDKLENGECSLEESIALFEQGMKYTNDCKKALEKAEKKIITLTQAEREENNGD